jgi:DNA repair protein RecN (Recombination protein N)
MMNAEGFASAVAEAQDAVGDHTLEARLNAALRKLERRRDGAGGRLDAACAALERAVVEFAETQRTLADAARAFTFNQRELETVEERLFALRGAARKHNVAPDALPELLQRFEADLAGIESGRRTLEKLEADAQDCEEIFRKVAQRLSRARRGAATKLAAEVMSELPPLKLERARFEVRIVADPALAGPHGIDRVEFEAAANPGTPLGPLAKVASGGELSRFMLALKVVLAQRGSAPTLIFDEIDTGVGGAVADAVGMRLARLAKRLQVLAVTHSPQVAARAGQHYLISKIAEVGAGAERVVTRMSELKPDSRREEIARMLSGARVTEEARAQADRLITRTG